MGRHDTFQDIGSPEINDKKSVINFALWSLFQLRTEFPFTAALSGVAGKGRVMQPSRAAESKHWQIWRQNEYFK